MATITTMIPDAVEEMAGGVGEMSEAISEFTKMIQAYIAVLHAGALTSFGVSEAQAQVLEAVVPIANQLADWTGETSQGMMAAVNAYREVVEAGAQMLSD